MPTRLSQICANIRDALAGIPTGNPGEFLFQEAGIYDDVASFVDLAAGKLGRRIAGVVPPAAPDRFPGMNADEAYSEAAEISILFSFTWKRAPSDDESGPADQMAAMADAIRTRVLADPSWGGLAGLVEWGGRVINGTDVDGAARLLPGSAANQAIFTAELPISVGWTAPVA